MCDGPVGRGCKVPSNGDATEEVESPLKASYQQGDLIKLMGFFGFLLGFVAFLYDKAMMLSIFVVWKMVPGVIENAASQIEGGQDDLNRWGFLYTIAACVTLSTAAGVCIKYLGYPGDLPYIIMRVHKFGYIPITQTFPMACVSLLSIAAGASVGPEAPLVAISASITGWLSINYFKHDMVMVRRCTIMGMSAGLSALFGVQLGGGLFALEVLHTAGMQFFDVAVYAIGAGGICLGVYRALQREGMGEIWDFPDVPESTTTDLIIGTAVGAIAGGVGLVFRSLFRSVGKGMDKTGLGHFADTKYPVVVAALGGLCASVIGVLAPPSMFWSELEIASIAEPGKDLPHIWPQGGIFYGLERYPWESGPMYIFVGAAKLLAITCSVQSGLRGGFIFPLFFAGASFGRGLLSLTDLLLPDHVLHATPALLCMSFAAGLNTAVLRTPFASPLILSALSGQPNITAPVVCASLTALFVTRSARFLGPQADRADLQFTRDLQPLQDPPATGELECNALDAGTGSYLNGGALGRGLSNTDAPAV